ncbi:hypothetical protein P12x_000003 [Tundrisphaera lichenicola]|uniref:hypothetical protein n=1 Tax=Tundrisphaera lichenicola TaxID=2029860 RepID=UPI003EB85014
MGFRETLTRPRRVTPFLLGVALLALALNHFRTALGPQGSPAHSPDVESTLEESREFVDESQAFMQQLDDHRRRIEAARGDERATARLAEEMREQSEELKRQVEERQRVDAEREASRVASDQRGRWGTGALGGLCLLLAAKFLADGFSATRRGVRDANPSPPG